MRQLHIGFRFRGNLGHVQIPRNVFRKVAVSMTFILLAAEDCAEGLKDEQAVDGPDEAELLPHVAGNQLFIIVVVVVRVASSFVAPIVGVKAKNLRNEVQQGVASHGAKGEADESHHYVVVGVARKAGKQQHAHQRAQADDEHRQRPVPVQLSCGRPVRGLRPLAADVTDRLLNECRAEVEELVPADGAVLRPPKLTDQLPRAPALQSRTSVIVAVVFGLWRNTASSP